MGSTRVGVLAKSTTSDSAAGYAYMQTQSSLPELLGSQPPILVTKPMIARRYTVCVRTVEHWIAEGRIPVVRLGRRAVRLDPVKCDRALERFEVRAFSDRSAL